MLILMVGGLSSLKCSAKIYLKLSNEMKIQTSYLRIKQQDRDSNTTNIIFMDIDG